MVHECMHAIVCLPAFTWPVTMQSMTADINSNYVGLVPCLSCRQPHMAEEGANQALPITTPGVTLMHVPVSIRVFCVGC